MYHKGQLCYGTGAFDANLGGNNLVMEKATFSNGKGNFPVPDISNKLCRSILGG